MRERDAEKNECKAISKEMERTMTRTGWEAKGQAEEGKVDEGEPQNL